MGRIEKGRLKETKYKTWSNLFQLQRKIEIIGD